MPAANGYVNSAVKESETAIISGTSAGAGDDALVTLTLTDGNNTIVISVTQVDATTGSWTTSLTTAQLEKLAEGTITVSAVISSAGTTAQSEDTAFVYDATAPALSQITPVPTPADIATPAYTFSSDEAGSITYGGSCTSAANNDATSGNNTILFDMLTVGEYSDCTITVTDAAGNISLVLSVDAFTITMAGPTAAFSVEDGAHLNDADTNFVITFSELVYADSSADTQFTDTTIAEHIMLRENNAEGTAIPFSATVNEQVVTIDPTDSLADGAVVYLAITDGYYNAESEQGNALSATITIDTMSPTIESASYAGTAVMVTMSEPVYGTVAANAFSLVTVEGALITPLTPESISDLAPDMENAGDSFVLALAQDDALTGSPTVTLSYTPSESTEEQISDAAGNTLTESTSVSVVKDDTTPPDTPTLSPIDTDTDVKVYTDITVMFDETVYQADGVTEVAVADFKGTDSIFTLEKVIANADDVSITEYVITEVDNTFTINPRSDLERGTEYRITVTDGYYDNAGNQGSAVTAMFTIEGEQQNENTDDSQDENEEEDDGDEEDADDEDSDEENNNVNNEEDEEEGIVVTFLPEENGTIMDPSTDITITFNQPVYSTRDSTPFTESDLATFVMLRTDDESGYGISFSASMNDENTVITVDPSEDLPGGEIYVGISPDHYTADGERGETNDVIFTINTDLEDIFTDFFSQMIMSILTAPIFNVPTIAQTYSFGMFDVNIKLAQILLDKSECPVTTIEAGSQVMVGYLDVFTEQALICYKNNRGIVPASGELTPQTFDSLVAEYYQNELSLVNFSSLLIVDDMTFRRRILMQTLIMVQRALMLLSIEDAMHSHSPQSNIILDPQSGAPESNTGGGGTEGGGNTETDPNEANVEIILNPGGANGGESGNNDNGDNGDNSDDDDGSDGDNGDDGNDGNSGAPLGSAESSGIVLNPASANGGGTE